LPAIPLLECQIILVCVLCLGMVIIESNEKILKVSRLDLWITLACGSGQSFSGLVIPSCQTHLCWSRARRILKCIAFSDAQTYDEFSQSVLVSNGFGANEIPQRLYISFWRWYMNNFRWWYKSK